MISDNFNHAALKERNLNFLETIFFLSFLFIPLKFFTFKIASLSLTFTRLLILLLVPIFIFHVLQKIKSKQFLLINSIYFNKYSLLLFIYGFISYIISILIYDGENFSSRIHLSSFSFFESFFIIPFLFFILVPSPSRQLKIFELVFKYLKVFIFFAFLQFFFDLGGFSVSYESIGEPAPENRADLLGFNILRLSSFFGEPRDLAICLIPIYLLNKISTKSSFKIIDIFIICSIGILTISSSFIQSVIATFAVWGFFSSLRFRIFSISIVSAFTILYLFNFELIRDSLILILPRYEIIFQILSPEIVGNIAQVSPEFKEQISDVSFIGYLLNGEIIKLTGIFGHGLGSGHFAIDKIAFTYFSIENEGILYGSRWLLYTLILELGSAGIFLIFLSIRHIYIKTNNTMKLNKLYIIIFFFTSLLGSAYIFILLSVYLSIESENIPLNKYLINDRSS